MGDTPAPNAECGKGPRHTIKSLREALCTQQTGASWPSDIASAVDVLINMIDRHRPLGSDGSHGNLHTPECGCEDTDERALSAGGSVATPSLGEAATAPLVGLAHVHDANCLRRPGNGCTCVAPPVRGSTESVGPSR